MRLQCQISVLNNFKSVCFAIWIKSLSKVTNVSLFLMQTLAIRKSNDPAVIPLDFNKLRSSAAKI